MASFWLLSKLLRHNDTIYKVVNIRFSSLQTTTTSAALWIQKALAPDKSIGPKSSFITTFASIINKVRPIKLQMPYLNILSKMPKKKLLFKPKTSRSCTGCNLSWPMFLAFPKISFLLFTRSLFAVLLFYLNYNNFGNLFKVK